MDHCRAAADVLQPPCGRTGQRLLRARPLEALGLVVAQPRPFGLDSRTFAVHAGPLALCGRAVPLASSFPSVGRAVMHQRGALMGLLCP